MPGLSVAISRTVFHLDRYSNIQFLRCTPQIVQESNNLPLETYASHVGADLVQGASQFGHCTTLLENNSASQQQRFTDTSSPEHVITPVMDSVVQLYN